MSDLEIEIAELKIKYGKEVFERIRLKVEKESLEERGLTLDDLQHLVWEDEDDDWAEKDSIHLVSSKELAAVMADQEVVLSF